MVAKKSSLLVSEPISACSRSQAPRVENALTIFTQERQYLLLGETVSYQCNPGYTNEFDLESNVTEIKCGHGTKFETASSRIKCIDNISTTSFKLRKLVESVILLLFSPELSQPSRSSRREQFDHGFRQDRADSHL